TRDAGVAQTIQNGRIHLLWQVNQGVANCNGDAAEVLSGQAALVRDSANNGTWANVLTLAHVQTVGLEVAVGTTLAASTTIVAVETVTSTATAVTVASTSAAIITIETVTLRSRHVLDQKLRAALQLDCKCCSNVIHRYIVGLGVLAN